MGTVNLSIFVSDISAVMLSYDTMRVRRSTDGTGGPYSEITASSPQSGSLLAPNSGSYDVVGKTLQLKMDGGIDTDIVFTGTGLLTTSQVVSQIESVFSGVPSDDSNKLRLTSVLEGTKSKVEVVGGGAAAEFGWADGDRDIGEEAYILLVAGQNNYVFVDDDGDASYFYQASFYNTTNGLTSSWSESFEGDAGTLVDASNLSTGSVSLVDAAGAAVAGQKITFYSQHEPLQVQSYQVALMRSPIIIETNNSGYAEVSLVRGLRVRVVFEGTNMIRDITIPDAPTFDLLALIANAQDPYDVVVPDIPDAIRRT